MRRSNSVALEPENKKRHRHQDSLPLDSVFNPLQSDNPQEHMDVTAPNPLSFYHYQPGAKLDDVLVSEVLTELFMKSGEAISLAHESPLKNNNCLLFLKAAENGNLSRVKELWDALYHSAQIPKLYFNQLKDDAILAANKNGHMNVIRFLEQGLTATLLDREPTEEEKQQVRDGYRLFAIIDASKVCKKTQTTSALTEAKIAFCNKHGLYETRIIRVDENKSVKKDNSRAKDSNEGIKKVLTQINILYLEESRKAKKENRVISEITLDKDIFIGQIKILLKEWGGYTTGFIHHRTSIADNKHYKVIMNAYDQGNLKLFYYWLATDKRFTWFCNFNRDLNLDLLPDNLELDALRYLFVLHAQHGHLSRVKIMMEHCPALLDSRALIAALFCAIENNQVAIVDYLPLQNDMIILHEEVIYKDHPAKLTKLTNLCLFYYILQNTQEFGRESIQKILGVFQKKDAEFFQELRSSIFQQWDKKCSHPSQNPWLHLTEFIFADPDFNPDFHSLPMPDAGLQLALQIDNLDLFKRLTITYGIPRSTFQIYYEQAKEGGSKEMQLLLFLASQEWQTPIGYLYVHQDAKECNYDSIVERYSLYIAQYVDPLQRISLEKYHFVIHNINLLLANPDIVKGYGCHEKWRRLITGIYEENGWLISSLAKNNDTFMPLYQAAIFKINLLALEDTFVEFSKLMIQLQAGPFSEEIIPAELTPLIMSFAIELARYDYKSPAQLSQLPFAQQQKFRFFSPVKPQQAEVSEMEEMDVEGPRL